MRLVIGFFAVMMLVATPVQAIDGAGNYSSFARRSCGEWLEDKRADNNKTFDVNRYGNKQWVAGYVTAVNIWIEGKGNWLGGSDIASAVLWIDKYCKENPLSNGSDAMWYLLRELGVKR